MTFKYKSLNNAYVLGINMDNNNLVDINEFVTDLYFMQEQNGGYIKHSDFNKVTKSKISENNLEHYKKEDYAL